MADFVITEHATLADALDFEDLKEKDTDSQAEKDAKQAAKEAKKQEGVDEAYLRTNAPKFAKDKDEFKVKVEGHLDKVGSEPGGRLIRMTEGKDIMAIYSNFISAGWFNMHWAYRYRDKQGTYDWFLSEKFKAPLYDYVKNTCGCIGFTIDCEVGSTMETVMINDAVTEPRWFLESSYPSHTEDGWVVHKFKFT